MDCGDGGKRKAYDEPQGFQVKRQGTGAERAGYERSEPKIFEQPNLEYDYYGELRVRKQMLRRGTPRRPHSGAVLSLTALRQRRSVAAPEQHRHLEQLQGQGCKGKKSAAWCLTLRQLMSAHPAYRSRLARTSALGVWTRSRSS